MIPNSFNKKNFLSHSFYFKTKILKRISKTKTRSEVKGSGRKLRAQKGTGNARLGSIKSPLLRGGGTSFGPKPSLKSKKINKKEKQLLKSILFFNKSNKINILNDFILLDLKKFKQFLKNLQSSLTKKCIIFYSSKNFFLTKHYLYLQNFQKIKFQHIKYFSGQIFFQNQNLFFSNLAFNEFNFMSLKNNFK